MAIDGISIYQYQIEYPVLNLKLLKENKRVFDLGILYCYAKELEKGFKVKKIYKTNKKGTKITYRAIESQQELDEYINEIEALNTKFKETYNMDLLHKECFEDETR